MDKRLEQVSARRAPVDEVVRTEALYRERYQGWNVKHFYSFYRRRHAGTRSYTWVKKPFRVRGWWPRRRRAVLFVTLSRWNPTVFDRTIPLTDCLDDGAIREGSGAGEVAFAMNRCC